MQVDGRNAEPCRNEGRQSARSGRFARQAIGLHYLATSAPDRPEIAWDTEGDVGERLNQHVLNSFQAGIAGGTDEIQRNIIGDRVLGLPRDISVDKGVPFNELKTS